MKRVWSLRHCLLLMDFEDNSSESMKQLLHQCTIHPMYLKLEEVTQLNATYFIQELQILLHIVFCPRRKRRKNEIIEDYGICPIV